MSQSQTNWEADKMLDVYIHDYLIKRKLHSSAKAFQTEGNVSTDPVATDAPGGFLFEWWSVFWDIYNTRTNRKHSEAAASYIETQLAKKRELQQQQIPKPQSMQMQQLLLQRQALLQQQQLQQQQRDENQHLHGSASGLTTNDVARYNSAGATLAAKIYEDEATLPLQRDSLDEAAKLQLQSTNQQQQQYTQLPLSCQQTQNSNHQLQQQDKIVSSGSISGDGSMLSTFQRNEQASKSQIARKRMQPGSSSGPANSSGTANTAGLSPSSPSSPSTHAPGDTMSMSAMSNNGGCSNALLKFASDGLGSLASAPNELADMDHFMDDRTRPAESTDKVGRSSDINKGLALSEIRIITASTSKVECCHFSSDGKLLATGGHDRKVTLWCTESFTLKSTLAGHSQCITDVRFSPTMSCLATASADKTIKVWGADNPGYSLRTFTAHSATVMSVDFHPSKGDLICSCDNDGEIRYWSIRNDICTSVFKGGATQVRFQPHHGRNLAAATENTVSILDVETQNCWLKLVGHNSNVQSVCWDPSGEFLASVSDDLVRVWMIGPGSKGACVNQWHGLDNKFHTCTFHPYDPSLLIIGCSETLELWDMSENNKTTLHAHDKLVSALAASNASGLVASASHDKCVKIWK